MRKFTLFFAFVALASFLFAQNAEVKKQSLTEADETQKINKKQQKSTKDAIWSEDFAGGLPEGWSIVDLSDENMPWAWTDGPVLGCYTEVLPSEVESETPENGYMFICPDGFNSIPQYTYGDGVVKVPDELEVVVDSYIESGPIDLSSVDGAVLEFYQDVRVYYDFSSAIWVSSDHDPANPELGHWAEWITQELGVNLQENGQHQINISEVAAGKDNVYIRIYAYGATHYYWIIDDMKIVEPLANNMRVNNSWLYYDWIGTDPDGGWDLSGDHEQHGGGYYKIPRDQVRPYVGARMAVENFGTSDQTSVVLNTEIYWKADSAATDSTLVFSDETTGAPYEAYSLDSLKVEYASSYKPTEWGHYEVYLTVKMENPDDYVVDNIEHYDFEVGDSTFSRTTEDVNSSAATTHWIGGGIDGDGLGQYYRLYKPITEAEAFRFHFAARNRDSEDIINTGGFTALAKIFAYNEVEEDWQISPLLVSNIYTAAITDTGKWITLDYVKDGSNEFLPAGDYNVFIETYSSVDDEAAFYIGEDLSIKQPSGAQQLWLEGSWGTAGSANFSFEFIHAADDWDTASVSVTDPGVIESKALQMGQNYPNPAVDKTEVKYVISNAADVTLSVYDLTGKRVMNVVEGMKPSGRHAIELNVSDLESGVYYYTLRAGQYEDSRKMVIMR